MAGKRARCVPVFSGRRLCPPAGFRWSPGANSHAIKVGLELHGKTGGGRGGQKQRFINATKGAR